MKRRHRARRLTNRMLDALLPMYMPGPRLLENNGHLAILIGREAKTCNLMTWARWFEACELDGVDGRRVAETVLGEGLVRVSTVFLGVDHGFGDAKRWFETMVFYDFPGDESSDQECWRYETYDQADAGHAHAVEVAQQRLEAFDYVRATVVEDLRTSSKETPT